jgi:protein SCO1/2
VATLLISALAACHHDEPWKLADIQHQLPDLHFALTSDTGQPITQAAFKGDITLVYFGYTHCPDVCPETMAKLTQVMHTLGSDAQHIKILFVSVDPARDTPAALHAYVDAFDARHAVGLTGSSAAIEALAKQYKVGYQIEQRHPDGSYDVTHSSVVYIFDGQGHARLLGTNTDSADAFVHDLRQMSRDAA